MPAIRRLVPNFIIEKYKANELHGSFLSAAIFVDLSGFSKMTDALSAHGQRGAEALADLMHVVFEPLVTAVYEQGGFVIGYAGDAFNAVFPEDLENPTSETQRCLAALVAMQAHMQTHSQVQTPFGVFPISIKSGMGFGETRWQMFKSETSAHLSYWLRGDSLNRAVHAEEKARSGDIIIDPVAHERIQGIVKVDTMQDGVRVSRIIAPLPAPASITEPEPDPSPMNFFFPENLTRQQITGEFRHVINMFIDIPINISDEALVAPFMQTVYDLQEKYGGFFLRPDLGDKGFNLLMFWGAPIARERDVERALHFITELSAHTKLPLRGSITYRIAYAGFMGAPLREDYTAYGWGVNLAARLMEHAGEGEFWLDEEIAQRAERTFDVKLLGDFSLKGFANKQRTYLLLGKKPETQVFYHGKLVGRYKEMNALASFSAPLQTGKFAGILVVSGEAGIGKSRVVSEFQTSDFFGTFQAQWFRFQSEELIRDSFNPFKNWLRKRFKVEEGISDDLNWITFSNEVDALAASTPDPELAFELKRTGSILAALVNINQPNTLYETLDAKSRYENTLIALSTLFRAESLQKPLYLFIEDTHWADEATISFLNYFVRSLRADSEKQYPIAIILTQRPQPTPTSKIEGVIQELTLGKLYASDLSAIAESTLGKPITQELGKLLEARTEGNPFFAEQILRYLQENDLLILDAENRYSASKKAETSLPVDVYTVMIARLDRLTQQVRETVQTASVLGREFVVDVLAEMLHTIKDELPKHVFEAEQADIWVSLEEINYIFRHTMLRDAAYSMQLAARKTTLHALAFSAMEEVYHADLEPHYSELAYHAEKGKLKDKALFYLTLSGNNALRAFQNHQAMDCFTRALAILPEGSLEREFDLLFKRVECAYNIGESTTQLIDLDRLEEIARALTDGGLLARALIRRAYRTSIVGDYGVTIEHARKARELAQRLNDSEILLSVYIILPDALAHIGKLEEAKQSALDAIDLARKIGNRAKEASAYSALGLVTLKMEGHGAARPHQEQALKIAREVKDRYLEAKQLNNIALSIVSEGDYHLAREYFQQALWIFQEQGNQLGKSLAYANLGWLCTILGDYAKAMENYEHALILAREQGAISEEMYTYVNLSASSSGQGNSVSAKEWARMGLEMAHQAKDHTAEAWAYFYLAHGELLSNSYSTAVENFQKSLTLRIEANIQPLVIETRAGLVDAYLALNNPAAAEKEAQPILEYMEKDPSFAGAEEPLRVYLSLYSYFDKTKDPRTSLVLQNAIQLLETQISKLRSQEARQVFVQNVPWRRALQDIKKQN